MTGACEHCERPLSDTYLRVMGDNHNTVGVCIHCRAEQGVRLT